MQVKSINKNKFLIFSTIGILAIGVFLLIDILIGMSDIGFKDIISAIFDYSGSKEDLIITTIKTTCIIMYLVGASMAISGLIMQNLTRNPLASSQVLGINAGATLSVVIVMVFSCIRI